VEVVDLFNLAQAAPVEMAVVVKAEILIHLKQVLVGQQIPEVEEVQDTQRLAAMVVQG
jgi:hypothetical protein